MLNGKELVNLAVIPARGGSKRVPRKNVRAFGSKSILAYSIEAALQSGIFERVVVSTDDREIAEIACDHGAEVPFLRDGHLADDLTPVSAATVDMLTRLDGDSSHFDYVCQLMPNCPLRTADDIVNSYQQLEATHSKSQISVVRYGWQNPWWAFQRNDQLQLEPLFKESIAVRSQDLPPLFCPTGAVWWAEAQTLKREGTYHVSNRTGWEISWQHGLDIDTEEDWLMAEVLLNLSQTVTKAHFS